jgi:predicted O-methyltransferase YrrM
VSSGRIVPHPVLGAPAQLTWSPGAMTPAGLAAVCAELAGQRCQRVVECGAGFSTLVLARLLRTRAGCLVSLEHDRAWATRVQSDLAAADLAEIARVTLAPLEPHPLALNGLPWYAQRALPSLPPRIDLLLVDGPPAFEPHTELSRYPALPALAERLVPDATVILDDIDRAGELRILKTWERDYDFRFEVRTTQRIAIGHRF